MQKALLMASVIIGAFLFQPNANSQVLTEDGKLGETNFDMCPLGGNYAPALGFCFVPATQKQRGIYECSVTGYGEAPDQSADSPEEARQKCISASASIIESGLNSNATLCEVSVSSTSAGVQQTYKQRHFGNCRASDPFITSFTEIFASLKDPSFYWECPPESSNENFDVFNLGPYETEEGYNICFYLSSDPGNDDDCPEGTIGGCEPPEPDCIIAGNGMEVCKEDPNEKCESTEQNGQTVYFNCEAGCGFVNDQFLCTTEPDSDGEIPDLSKCFKVGNSWACPSDPTTPDDNIQNPEKPLPDMNKGDFKEVQKGVETRLDATNSLLGESNAIGKAIGDGIGDLNAKSLAANGILSAIRTNTGATAGNTKDILDLLKDNLGEGEPLELDNDWRGVFSSGLGITGDETIDDLTKEEITLDKFKSEFQWTGGNSSCPAPRPINILRQTFYMDWEPFCSAFNVIGYLILAAAYFLSIRIAFGGRS